MKTVYLIVGPTASGKTAAAMQLAQSLDTEIISADSRQCYHELNIGVARPSPEELAAVKHWFIASHSIHEPANAAAFEEYALAASAAIFKSRDHLVMVGGTGLYIRAFCEGMDKMPSISPELRNDLQTQYETRGMSWLQSEVAAKDPLYFSSGEIDNPHRLLRALEMVLTTGHSIREYQKGQKANRDFEVKKFGIMPPIHRLHQQIHSRVDQMVAAGLEAEVKGLLPHQKLLPLQTVGYQEMFDYLNNRLSLAQAIAEIKTHTRQYAKRQLTWFKRDPAIKWVEAGNRLSEIT